MKRVKNVPLYLMVLTSLLHGISVADEAQSTLNVSSIDLVPAADSHEVPGKEKRVTQNGSNIYPVRLCKDEVQVLLGHFGREGIVWAQLPANALSAALKSYPNAHKIRLFWEKRTGFGGQWSDKRSTVLFVKQQRKIRFFTKTESYYAEEIHQSTELLELQDVTPQMIHSTVSSFTLERKGSLVEVLQARGARTKQKRISPQGSK